MRTHCCTFCVLITCCCISPSVLRMSGSLSFANQRPTAPLTECLISRVLFPTAVFPNPYGLAGVRGHLDRDWLVPCSSPLALLSHSTTARSAQLGLAGTFVSHGAVNMFASVSRRRSCCHTVLRASETTGMCSFLLICLQRNRPQGILLVFLPYGCTHHLVRLFSRGEM